MVNDFVLMLAVALDKLLSFILKEELLTSQKYEVLQQGDRQTKLRQTKCELSFIRVWFYAINIHNSSIDLFVVLTHGEKA